MAFRGSAGVVTSHVIAETPIPVTLITGFLGSGKTTLLRHLLGQPELADAAVIVNEFGDIGLDHLLLERGDESTLLLDSGCLCCTLQGDLVTTLQDLLDRRVRGDVPAFSRVMIETTGLADPGALIRMFWSDPLRLSRYTFDRTVTCVDAVTAVESLAEHREARRQIAFADILVVTKTDLGPAGRGDCRGVCVERRGRNRHSHDGKCSRRRPACDAMAARRGARTRRKQPSPRASPQRYL